MAALSGMSAIPRASSARAKRPIVSTETGSALATPIAAPLSRAIASSRARAASIASGSAVEFEDEVGARGGKSLTGRKRHGEALRGRPVIDVK